MQSGERVCGDLHGQFLEGWCAQGWKDVSEKYGVCEGCMSVWSWRVRVEDEGACVCDCGAVRRNMDGESGARRVMAVVGAVAIMPTPSGWPFLGLDFGIN